MTQCQAKTKDGNLCQKSAREGQKYCHVHLRQRLWWRRIIPGSTLVGALLLGVLSFVSNIASVLSFLGVSLPVNSIPTSTLTPTVTRIFSRTAAAKITTTANPIITPFDTITSTLAPSATQVSSKDGMLYLNVPAGEFIMGSNNGFPDEKPEHTVYLDTFWVAQTEVTNAMYGACVDASACDAPTRSDYYSRDASSPEYPVVFVSWNNAKQYCEWIGGRLPTEAEWEFASRGTDERIYPWGNQFECARGNFDDEVSEDPNFVFGGPNCDGYQYLAPVGKFLSGVSPFGLLDMAGNVWEWVSDWYGEYKGVYVTNPTGPVSGSRRVVRGGAWLNDKDMFFRTSNRYSYPPDLVDDNVGFRCVLPKD